MNKSIRKLAAIMFTDIAGYTALSAKDEERALDLIELQRELLKPIVAEFGGDWLKEIGDGLLLSFPSSKQAVNCAIKIQHTIKEIKNLNLRIGIHQGDILEKSGDVFGDDVNIASRIEPFAAVGGVAISDKVHRDISGSPEITTKYVGRPRFKGVRQEVKVYCITSYGLPQTVLSDVFAKLEKKPISWIKVTLSSLGAILVLGIGVISWYIYPFLSLPEPLPRNYDKAIAVLYFDNMGFEEDAYFVDGLTEELITRLARIQNLKVASRTDVGLYRAQPASIEQIGRDLNVDYVVEGSVRKSGDQLRVTAQLIKTVDGFHLWARTFDRMLNDIFVIQDEVTSKIASQLAIEISKKDRFEITHRPTENLEAYDSVLRAQSLLLRLNFLTPAQEFERIKSILERAIHLDPDYSEAHITLATTYLLNVLFITGLDSSEYIRLIEKASLEAEEALALDPTNEMILAIPSFIMFAKFEMNLLKKEFRTMHLRKAMVYIRKLSKLYPDSPISYYAKSYYYGYRSDTPLGSDGDWDTSLQMGEEALNAAERSMKAGNANIISIWIAKDLYPKLGNYYYSKGSYEKALEYLLHGLNIQQRIGDKSGEGISHHLMGELLILMGDYSQSSAHFDSASKIWVEIDNAKQNLWTLSWWAISEVKSGNIKKAKSKTQQVEILLKSNDPYESDFIIVNWNISQVYSALGENKKAVKHLENAYNEIIDRANKIKELKDRESFLTNIRENREVVAAWEGLNGD
jgi:TolB-like protein/class 3 adenylate cyclase